MVARSKKHLTALLLPIFIFVAFIEDQNSTIAVPFQPVPHDDQVQSGLANEVSRGGDSQAQRSLQTVKGQTKSISMPGSQRAGTLPTNKLAEKYKQRTKSFETSNDEKAASDPGILSQSTVNFRKTGEARDASSFVTQHGINLKTASLSESSTGQLLPGSANLKAEFVQRRDHSRDGALAKWKAFGSDKTNGASKYVGENMNNVKGKSAEASGSRLDDAHGARESDTLDKNVPVRRVEKVLSKPSAIFTNFEHIKYDPSTNKPELAPSAFKNFKKRLSTITTNTRPAVAKYYRKASGEIKKSFAYLKLLYQAKTKPESFATDYNELSRKYTASKLLVIDKVTGIGYYEKDGKLGQEVKMMNRVVRNVKNLRIEELPGGEFTLHVMAKTQKNTEVGKKPHVEDP